MSLRRFANSGSGAHLDPTGLRSCWPTAFLLGRNDYHHACGGWNSRAGLGALVRKQQHTQEPVTNSRSCKGTRNGKDGR